MAPNCVVRSKSSIKKAVPLAFARGGISSEISTHSLDSNAIVNHLTAVPQEIATPAQIQHSYLSRDGVFRDFFLKEPMPNRDLQARNIAKSRLCERYNS
jgi:hypothetical protein